MSNIFFKAINNLSYMCSMQHLFSNWPYSYKFYWKDLSVILLKTNFCTRKIKRAKFNKHNNLFLRLFKHYRVNVFVEELQKVNFSNYECFSCIDAAYTDFLNKLTKVVNEIAPSKEIRIKNNTQEWFDSKIFEMIMPAKDCF